MIPGFVCSGLRWSRSTVERVLSAWKHLRFGTLLRYVPDLAAVGCLHGIIMLTRLLGEEADALAFEDPIPSPMWR